jgi:hypothetical protein
MMRSLMAAQVLTAVALCSPVGVACPGGGEAEAEKTVKAEPSTDFASEPEEKDYTVVTGLDFAMWWMGDLRLSGPGISVGFVLVPDHFEMYLSFGAMLGSRVYLVPVELTFAVPFRVASWLNVYLDFGPTLLLDKAHGERTPDWALSAGAGLEMLPPGFDWGIYLEGDYNFRFQQAIDHQGGFSVGFRYRF